MIITSGHCRNACRNCVKIQTNESVVSRAIREHANICDFPCLSIVVKAANFKAYLFVAWLVSKNIGLFPSSCAQHSRLSVSNYKTIFSAPSSSDWIAKYRLLVL